MNPHILIVGYGSGLSHAIAKRFASEGFDVSAISRSALSSELSVAAGTRKYLHTIADAGKPEQLRAAIAQCEQKLGAIQVLVYNAFAWNQALLSATTIEEFETSLRANIVGALVAAHAVLPAMQEAKSGTLLFTGGGLALHTAPKFGTLSIGKAGIRNLALTLAQELAPNGIHAATVTIAGFIHPGTFFDPERIAEVYWQLHREADGDFRSEVVYRP